MSNQKLLKLMNDNGIDKDMLDEVWAYIDRTLEHRVLHAIGGQS